MYGRKLVISADAAGLVVTTPITIQPIIPGTQYGARFHHGFCCVRVSSIGLRLLYGVRFSTGFYTRGVPLRFTPLLWLKLLHACDQWHSSRVFTLSYRLML
jgi:hypothetical protein